MRRRGQAGETLVEILVSTTLLGIIGIGIIGAIASVLISTDIDRKASEAETIIRSYASAITRAAYEPCPNADYSPSDVGFDVPPRHTAKILSVQSWNGGGPTVVPTIVSPPSQPSDLTFDSCSGSDHGLQQLELQVDAIGGRGTEHLTLFKRDPAARPTTTSAP